MGRVLFNNTYSGQSLIEVLIALGSAVTVVIAISTVVVASINNAQYSRSQVLATQYAQEAIESMRKLRDADWATFKTFATNDSIAGNTYCFNKNATQPQTLVNAPIECGENITNNDNVSFIRIVNIVKNSTYCQPPVPPAPTPTPVATGGTKITAQVYWKDSKCVDQSNLYCHKAIQTVCLTDYTVIQAP